MSKLVTALKSLLEVDHTGMTAVRGANVVQIIASYGGQENTQVAGALLLLPRLDSGYVIKNYGAEIGRLYARVRPTRYLTVEDWRPAADALKDCCQGAAIVYMALELEYWLNMVRSNQQPPKGTGKAFASIMQVLQANDRIMDNPEDPSLRTQELFDELLGTVAYPAAQMIAKNI